MRFHRRLPVDGYDPSPLDQPDFNRACSQLTSLPDGQVCLYNGGFTLYLTENKASTSAEQSTQDALRLIRDGMNGDATRLRKLSTTTRLLQDDSTEDAFVDTEGGILDVFFLGRTEGFQGELADPPAAIVGDIKLAPTNDQMTVLGGFFIAIACLLFIVSLFALKKRNNKYNDKQRDFMMKDDLLDGDSDEDDHTVNYKEGSIHELALTEDAMSVSTTKSNHSNKSNNNNNSNRRLEVLSHIVGDDDDDTAFSTPTTTSSTKWRRTRAAHVVGEDDSIFSSPVRTSDHSYILDDLATEEIGNFEVQYQKPFSTSSSSSPHQVGRTHSGMNVHHCKSSTCEICSKRKIGATNFVRTDSFSVASHATPPVSRVYSTNDTVQL
eukprot:CAMPEP_0118723890 /NCGR_PEP_ID=MMETSP0800-20121206/32251_1 /TAXON_ID=210618 ORGANISM="Striatella unipunctata, Strain CCMP2910" /NCGR_SAMPLE_ID=MMETSP0800 /ASSEMBLY_ACC=CAM_ASM_000638 /LENGTH=379 /DNA_ID=CAMNT_0006632359 /DNA_START=90 /DNA_END=1229 /DNA_ORIENTATION=+